MELLQLNTTLFVKWINIHLFYQIPVLWCLLRETLGSFRWWLKGEMLLVESRFLVEEQGSLKGYDVLQSICCYWLLVSLPFSHIHCLACTGVAALAGSARHCVMDRAGRDVLGFGELEVEGQQVESFSLQRVLTDSKSQSYCCIKLGFICFQFWDAVKISASTSALSTQAIKEAELICPFLSNPTVTVCRQALSLAKGVWWRAVLFWGSSAGLSFWGVE